MKTSNYLWAVLATAALSLTACSSEENEMQPQKMEAELNLTIQGTAANTKTTGSSLPTDESKINRLTVAIFNSDGNVNVIQEFTTTTGVTVNCTPGQNCTGIVVANAPTGHFAGTGTKTAFEAKILDLTQTSTNLPMSGTITTTDASPKSTFTLTAGTPATLTAKISRIVARVAINSVKTAFDAAGQYKNATFKLKKVFMHNANTKSTVNPASPAGSVPLSGKTDGTNPDLQSILATPQNITGTLYTTPYWFYTFAHNATTPTKLVLYGEFDADGAGSAAAENVYYPVVVNKAQTGTTITGSGTDSTIEPNSAYTITATIKGKGVDDPDKDINPAVINLSVTVAGWALTITQDVTFN